MADNDPCASGRDELRDVVKWLAAALGGLAAAVLAGTTLTGISGLSGPNLVLALAAGGIALVCILIDLGLMLRLLMTSTAYFSELVTGDEFAAIRKKINDHAADVLSPVFGSIEELARQRDALIKTLEAHKGAPLSAEYQTAKKDYDELVDHTVPLLRFAKLERMRDNLKAKLGWLFLFALIALVGLGTFAVLTGEAKDSTAAGAGELATLTAGKEWSALAQALASRCGDIAERRVQIVGQPQPGWITVRLLSPEACSGMSLTLPAGAMAKPDSKAPGAP